MKPRLVFPYGQAQIGAVLRASADDFRVDEQIAFSADGDGEHWLIRVEKRDLSTPELVERLARDCAIHPREIGFCGLKDKHAVSRQWVSLHLPRCDIPAAAFAGDGYRILDAKRHRRKLRRGSHRANRFEIRLREVQALPAATRSQLERIGVEGMANYFGVQRFGTRQDNVDQALEYLQRRRLSRSRKSILISSLRSYLFNLILARRIELNCWRDPVAGDVFMLRGSRSIFNAAADAEIRKRLDDLDLSCCASLYGSGENLLRERAGELEDIIFAAHPEIIECLDRLGSRRQMRALRVAVADFDFDYAADSQLLELAFTLPAGSYATVLLDHFVVRES